MKTLFSWFEDYAVSHRHPTNKKIHYVCVPTIMYTLLGLFWCIPTPEIFAQVPHLNWAILFICAVLVWYFVLDIGLALFMVVITAAMCVLVALVDTLGQGVLLYSSIAIFIIAWIGQFIGHKIEGKKPSFFQDLTFLLIGPLWVFYPLYSKVFRRQIPV